MEELTNLLALPYELGAIFALVRYRTNVFYHR